MRRDGGGGREIARDLARSAEIALERRRSTAAGRRRSSRRRCCRAPATRRRDEATRAHTGRVTPGLAHFECRVGGVLCPCKRVWRCEGPRVWRCEGPSPHTPLPHHFVAEFAVPYRCLYLALMSRTCCTSGEAGALRHPGKAPRHRQARTPGHVTSAQLIDTHAWAGRDMLRTLQGVEASTSSGKVSR